MKSRLLFGVLKCLARWMLFAYPYAVCASAILQVNHHLKATGSLFAFQNYIYIIANEFQHKKEHNENSRGNLSMSDDKLILLH